jgi:xanthine/uracil permease
MRVYLTAFAIFTLASTILLLGISEEGLSGRDALIIGAVFGSLMVLALWRWQEDRKANRRVWNTIKMVLGRR